MKKILLDEFHVSIYVKKGVRLSALERRKLENFFSSMVWLMEFPLNDHLKKKLKIEITR